MARASQEETAQVTLVRCDQPFEMFRYSYVRHRFAPHVHETYSLGVIDSGSARLRYRGSDVTFAAGDVITLEPNEVHTGEPEGRAGWSYRMFYLPVELVSRLGADDAGEPTFAQARYSDPEVATRLRALHDLLEFEPDLLKQASALASVVHLLCERHAATRLGASVHGRSRRMERVREYMEVHFARGVTLDELARLAGVSPFHLIRLFRHTYGLSPYAYFDHVRVNRAKAMIQEGADLADVACRVGFSDQSHMTRRFKRVFGVPPGRYARNYSRVRNEVGSP